MKVDSGMHDKARGSYQLIRAGGPQSSPTRCSFLMAFPAAVGRVAFFNNSAFELEVMVSRICASMTRAAGHAKDVFGSMSAVGAGAKTIYRFPGQL